MGEIFIRIIQERLQAIAEHTLPESQCGFRKGRGCVDMIFVARQLMEKAIEHGETLFVLFIDLKKAYDSIPGLVAGVEEVWGTPNNAEHYSVLPLGHEG